MEIAFTRLSFVCSLLPRERATWNEKLRLWVMGPTMRRLRGLLLSRLHHAFFRLKINTFSTLYSTSGWTGSASNSPAFWLPISASAVPRRAVAEPFSSNDTRCMLRVGENSQGFFSRTRSTCAVERQQAVLEKAILEADSRWKDKTLAGWRSVLGMVSGAAARRELLNSQQTWTRQPTLYSGGINARSSELPDAWDVGESDCWDSDNEDDLSLRRRLKEVNVSRLAARLTNITGLAISKSDGATATGGERAWKRAMTLRRTMSKIQTNSGDSMKMIKSLAGQ